ncbi:MAG: hypothetical protein A3I88_03070 [Candidatus Portnoybacteria bacterium RIFCSPLOWO2_12_FULL_39_9]|uniref:Large ribosomal subunit protein bL25 n=1 Tax=Candidatus Portnoybacteria bacterium RIFCSPHIGHO2_12_FULL_38_9 TaxID=1801997 RepID=A0A1G2FG58_9BACT|nr:MAG: hypothetical protein A3H00_00255 [Candidatus Portnoybacteria bacterium RBG_13_40_8]OGZ36220.1 MAG: hypothetical protein A2646_02330 [Candidatus Portnoybacteria bacterium RIFCSPHIGHO2_02_FULL_39_12]OGZ36792.1 MAG: hypothetical protein A3J64_02495 [Candidatus Portnoybacteria bacterium RIFCSPHIGHO2_12_FULL_38_9]OGZ38056.1 MAG: hypothetical protein A3F21_00420 [Candidatus Portnoybacteria bacterium RIFCSPLOWO2_01_FULL_38_39]OGZ41085.1 MAG: hypothetical protein A3I88_03070 [Candidatus Portnoy
MLELAVKLRQKTDKNKQIRKQGLIPAVLYGHRIENQSLTVKTRDFEGIYREAGENTLIKLKIENKKLKTGNEKAKIKEERTVLIHDVSKDPVTDKFIHADFYQVKMDEKLKAEVPLEFINQSPAVLEQEGVLIKSIQQVMVEALPENLPKGIKVDVSFLKTFNDNIHVKDLEAPLGVKILAGPEEVVASVIPPRKEKELEEIGKTPEEKIEEVKVEGEEKREAKAKAEEEKEEKKSSQ